MATLEGAGPTCSDSTIRAGLMNAPDLPEHPPAELRICRGSLPVPPFAGAAARLARGPEGARRWGLPECRDACEAIPKGELTKSLAKSN